MCVTVAQTVAVAVPMIGLATIHMLAQRRVGVLTRLFLVHMRDLLARLVDVARRGRLLDDHRFAAVTVTVNRFAYDEQGRNACEGGCDGFVSALRVLLGVTVVDIRPGSRG